MLLLQIALVLGIASSVGVLIALASTARRRVLRDLAGTLQAERASQLRQVSDSDHDAQTKRSSRHRIVTFGHWST